MRDPFGRALRHETEAARRERRAAELATLRAEARAKAQRKAQQNGRDSGSGKQTGRSYLGQAAAKIGAIHGGVPLARGGRGSDRGSSFEGMLQRLQQRAGMVDDGQEQRSARKKGPAPSANDGPKLPTQRARVRLDGREQWRETLTVRFEPGHIGLRLLGNRVAKAPKKGTQAALRGVRGGWAVVAVDGQAAPADDEIIGEMVALRVSRGEPTDILFALPNAPSRASRPPASPAPVVG